MVLEVDETPHGQLSAWYGVNGGVEGIGYDDAERVDQVLVSIWLGICSGIYFIFFIS